MVVTIQNNEVRFALNAFINAMPYEDRLYIAKEALYKSDVLKKIVDDIINGPPKPGFLEARRTILEHTPDVYKKLVSGLMSIIEIKDRQLKSANERAAKLYYNWPKEKIADRPKEAPYCMEIPIPDADVERIIIDYFEAKKNDNSA
jgi:hypothetical protein